MTFIFSQRLWVSLFESNKENFRYFGLLKVNYIMVGLQMTFHHVWNANMTRTHMFYFTFLILKAQETS